MSHCSDALANRMLAGVLHRKQFAGQLPHDDSNSRRMAHCSKLAVLQTPEEWLATLMATLTCSRDISVGAVYEFHILTFTCMLCGEQGVVCM